MMGQSSVLVLLCMLCVYTSADYAIDINHAHHTFDGIGALSAGASSALLRAYPVKQRSEILDLLFLPKFGASLQILKVEIGGDGQSTDGTEASHMHTEQDVNFKRGYEWFLCVEAKKRNPNIKLSALSWTFPSWVGKGDDPYTNLNSTVKYTLTWIQGAKSEYNLTIDYIGVWNERPYNIEYIKLLRRALDDAGFHNTEIVASDNDWSIVGDVLKDQELANAISTLGVHYPGTLSPAEAKQTGKKLAASEDYSTYNDMTGGGCWARILNQNFVNGAMTSTIAWNLIASYYAELPFGEEGLMTAMQPWSGYYKVLSPIWVTAHTTQFSEIGWKYLDIGSGSGKLEQGGSYVSLYDEKSGHFTLVVEKMSSEHSACIRPALPPFHTADETAVFRLHGSLSHLRQLSLWYSHFTFVEGELPVWFEQQQHVEVLDGTFTLNVTVNSIYTLTTTAGQRKGGFANIPPAQPFPVYYQDNFDSYEESSQPNYFTDQAGCFEIMPCSNMSRGMILFQIVSERPIRWINDIAPFTIIGDNSASNMDVEVDALIVEMTGGVVLGARVNGPDVTNMAGIYWLIYGDGSWLLCNSTANVFAGRALATGKGLIIGTGRWHTYRLQITGDSVTLIFDNRRVGLDVKVPIPNSHGWASLGTPGFDLVQFDNFSLARH